MFSASFRLPVASLPMILRAPLTLRMKLISWNVNGLRSVLKKGFAEFLARESPDVLALQEIKCSEADCEALWMADYTSVWNSAEKKGYSGTALFSKRKPERIALGLGDREENEGRVITADFGAFYLVNVYCPNSKGDLSRLPYRQQWDRDLLAYWQTLERAKPVIVCGDLNVAHTELDIAHPKRNERTAGYTIEERRGFELFMQAGFIDTFRHFEKGGGHYTWWSNLRRPASATWAGGSTTSSPLLRSRQSWCARSSCPR
jgi:exodeoxyribonuclease-3